MSRGFLVPKGDGVIIRCRVSPGAKRTSLQGAYGEDALRLRVAAPPAGGRANAEAERFVAQSLGVPRSDVSVVRGAVSGDKALLVRGVAVKDLRETLIRYETP
ncbi:MAG: DUF167 domain-containing protein [Rubrobacter sp.]